MSQEKQLEQNYNYTVVRQFTLVTILWGYRRYGCRGFDCRSISLATAKL